MKKLSENCTKLQILSDPNLQKMRLITKPTNVRNEEYSYQVMYHLSERGYVAPKIGPSGWKILYYATLQINTATYKKYQSYNLTKGGAQDVD